MKKSLIVSVLLVLFSALSFAGGIYEYKGNTYYVSELGPYLAAEWCSNGPIDTGADSAVSGDKFYFIGPVSVSDPIISRGTVISGDLLELRTGTTNPTDATYGTYTGQKFLLSSVPTDIRYGLWVAGYADAKAKRVTITDIFTSEDDLETKVRKIE